VYVSTDYVFEGRGEAAGLYRPGDAVNPQSKYALSK
jgi:dTDP-4-dehydrorhamnose reductase